MESEWIASLVARSISIESDGKPIPSKKERIDKRNSKKRRRDERKKVEYFPTSSVQVDVPSRNREYLHDRNQKKLVKIARDMEIILDRIHNKSKLIHAISDGGDRKGRIHKVYTPPQTQVKGKAVSRQQLSLENIQPVKSCYGGQGLARPSLLVSLRDPSFVPKFEEEFSERE
jgi:hypothetical protein